MLKFREKIYKNVKILLVSFLIVSLSFDISYSSVKRNKKKKSRSYSTSFSLKELKTLLSDNISAKSCILYDVVNKKIIYSRKPFKAMPPASLTKMLTAIVTIENTKNLDKVITIKKSIYIGRGGVVIGLRKGDKVTIRDLLYAALLYSANDACVALAKHTSGSVKKFVKLMNEKAKEIGVINSNFKNTNGMPNSMHYTTAYDLSLIASYAMKNPIFRKIVGTKYHRIKIITHKVSKVRKYPRGDFEISKQFDGEKKSIVTRTRNIRLKNRHKLLGKYRGINGIKTGYTRAAGRCLATDYSLGNSEIIIIILNSRNVVNDTINLIGYEKDCISNRQLSYNCH